MEVRLVLALDQEPVHAALADQPAHEVGAGLDPLRAAHQDLVAESVRRILDPADQLAVDGVGQVRDDQGDRERLRQPERAGRVARRVAQRLGGRVDPPSGLLRARSAGSPFSSRETTDTDTPALGATSASVTRALAVEEVGALALPLGDLDSCSRAASCGRVLRSDPAPQGNCYRLPLLPSG